MTKFRKQLFSVLTAGSMLLSIASPALADTTVQISGNGSGSNNDVNVSQEQSTVVTQDNTADITNNVSIHTDTGDNKANLNTGGDVMVVTGDANVDTTVSNLVNKNVASVQCCDTGDVDVLIEGNGATPTKDPDANKVTLDLSNSTQVFQANEADVKNNVDVHADTGDNQAKLNTGGDVTIVTGNVDANVAVSTAANANVAKVSGGGENSISARILGNGSGSQNEIKLDLDKESLISQENSAYVHNNVDVHADTGDNEANLNTGGDVAILTGDANVGVNVENWLNFNSAVLDCGCTFGDLLAKIDGNGAYSKNKIKLNLNNEEDGGKAIFQTNGVRLHNDLDKIKAETGDNEANLNTGVVEGVDPQAIVSGDTNVDVEVQNAVNLNDSGSESEFPWQWPGNSHVSLTIDLNALLAALGLTV